MFERFTDRARRVVSLSQEEARTFQHNYIGTEHILLALIREDEGLAAKSLKSLGASLEDARSRVEEIAGRGQQAPSGHIPFTPRAKKVLEQSLRESLHLGHPYISTEHLLLGLVSEGEGAAIKVLGKMGIEPIFLREQVINQLKRDSPPLKSVLKEAIELTRLLIGHNVNPSEELIIALWNWKQGK